jgi:hypothetical protein
MMRLGSRIGTRSGTGIEIEDGEGDEFNERDCDGGKGLKSRSRVGVGIEIEDRYVGKIEDRDWDQNQGLGTRVGIED